MVFSIAALAGLLAIESAGGSVLDCQTSGTNTGAYGQFDWTGVTADLNTANGGALTVAADLSNLSSMLAYNGLWVDCRQTAINTFTTAETANLQAYIATGRRVVLIGGPGPQSQTLPNSTVWNDAIMSAVDGPTGTSYFTTSAYAPNATPSRPTSPVDANVSAITVPAGAVTSSGSSLFADRVATVWGPAENVIVFLDTATLSDDYLGKQSDGTFAANLASWVAGAESDGPSPWSSSIGGNWQDASKWQPYDLPNIGDDAVFNLGSAGYTVTVPTPLTARNLLVENDHVTIDLSTSSSSLTMMQGIAVGQNPSDTGALTITHSSGGKSTAINAASLSIGGSGSGSGTGTVTVTTGTQLNITGATTVSSSSSLIVNGGAVTTKNLSAAGTVSITAGEIQIAAASSFNSLNAINTLSIMGTGTLDLANTDLDIQNSTLPTITNDVRSGYAGGTWTGNGITSAAAATDTSHRSALGVIINNDGSGHALFGSGTTMGLFDGANPGINDILVKYTYFGDANLDGRVDGSDYTRIDNGFNNHLTGWFNGDFNYDGIVDGSDYTLIDNAFNTQASPLAQIASETPVPEPTSIIGMSLMAMLALRRRARRSGL